MHHKVFQEQFVLRVVLFILRANGFAAPHKKQVLNFIRLRRLLNIPEDELEKRWDGDHDEIWKNDVAWKRKDLYQNGHIDSPERGHWRLTVAGVKDIENRKHKWLKLDTEDGLRDFVRLGYFTTELATWLLKIAKGQSLSLTEKGKEPNQSLQPTRLPPGEFEKVS